MKNIETLNLRSNKKLKKLSNEIGNLTNLKTLHLDNNNLTEIPESIGNLIDLKYLILNNNNLIKIPESIGNLKNLNTLHLTNNNLYEIPDAIGNLKNLFKLNLSENKIENLPRSIRIFSKSPCRIYLDRNPMKMNQNAKGLGMIEIYQIFENNVTFDRKQIEDIEWYIKSSF